MPTKKAVRGSSPAGGEPVRQAAPKQRAVAQPPSAKGATKKAATHAKSSARPQGNRPATKTPASSAKAQPSPKKQSAQPPAPSKPQSRRQVSQAAQETPTIAISADLVDEQLEKYRSMRDFAVTAEPSGDLAAQADTAAKTPGPSRSRAPARGLPFVIQKHAASHLHYDFRLGWSGVLKSWAVAKGPSYTTADRRLAVQVEDHPIEYGGFEGIIPKGQYGGGTVMVWDQGIWWPQPGHENVDAGLRTGSLKFELQGEKLHGKWTLVRMHTTKPYGGDAGRWKSNDKPQWLLIKEHDEFERSATAAPITDTEPNSALTGRTMEEIAAQGDHVWNSKETAGPGQAWYRKETSPEAPEAPEASAVSAVGTSQNRAATPPTKARTRKLQEQLEEWPTEPQPEFIQPQLAQETEQPPDGTGWLHELKLDGYRMQARKSARGVQLLTRSGLDWTYRVPAVAEAVAALDPEAITLDGEVVVLAEDGTTNFANLQASFQNNERHPLTFFCFDLLHLEGRNPRNAPLRARKALLAEVLPTAENSVVRLSEHMESNGRQMFEQACQLHAEGIVSKRADDPYQAGRRASWLKSKCLHEQEFVIGGFTPSSDGPDRVGSLLIGYYEGKTLIYAGRAGTGYTQKQRRELRAQLAPLETKSSPFSRLPAEARRDALWVRPELVAQVRFATWTAEDLVRQAAFLGLREDKAAAEVVRETAAPQPKSNDCKASHAARQTETPLAGTASGKRQSGHVPDDRSVSAQKAESAAAKPSVMLASAPATLRLTHPKKVLDPISGLTKQQLADYYWAVAARMLPHIADRPLSLVRCPDGAGKPCFYQKHVNSMLPPGIGSVMVADKKGGKPEPYITLNTPEALTGLAQIGVLEVHPWGSRNANLECPDRLTFDLDPDEALTWSTVADAAREVRARLKKAGLESFLKTTGGKGLHIVAPIAPEHDFSDIKNFAHRFVEAMARANPRLYLTKMTKAARTGRIYLDYLRNERGATAVAPFSPRSRPGVPASVPLDWKELDDPSRPNFPVAALGTWAARLKKDPWKRMADLQQALDPAKFREAERL